jgi:cell division protein FtsQ
VDGASNPSRRTAAAERTVKLAQRHFARRQRARRWSTLRWLAALAVTGAVVAGGAWVIYFSSLLAVDAVEVRGVDVLAAGEVRRAAQVPVGEPLATVAVDAVAERVASLAPVASVDVARAWPDRLRIEVVEREVVAVVERAGSLHGVDQEGVLFRRFQRPPAGLPRIRVSAGTPSAAVAEAAAVIDALPARIAARVDHLTVRTIDSISLRLRDGRSVFWGSADQSANKAEVLSVLLEQDASVYDVSVPGRPTITR